MAKRFLNNKIMLAAVALLTCSTFANAQQQEASVFAVNAKLGFFNHDSVADLNQPLEYTDQQEIQMGPSKGFDLSKDFKLNKELNNKDSKTLKQAGSEQDKIPEGVDPQEYVLKKEFGDPSVPVPVKGTENAPAPYRAMLKAYEMGRDDLALQYAEQWMGYIKSLDRITKKATTMSQIVALRPDQIETNLSPEVLAQIDADGLQKYIEKKSAQMIEANKGSEVSLNPEAVEKINALFGENDNDIASKILPKQDDNSRMLDRSIQPDVRRRLIRQNLQGKLPLDLTGKIKILFFHKPSDAISTLVGTEITKALSSEGFPSSVSIVPLSVEPISSSSSSEFIEKTGLPAILKDGVSLYRIMNIAKAPAVVFMSSTSDKTFVQTGSVDSVFIEEVVKMIGGM